MIRKHNKKNKKSDPIVEEQINDQEQEEQQINDQEGIKNLNECMKMIMKNIKKSKEYKELPRNIGKSKLNKKKLCKAINKN